MSHFLPYLQYMNSEFQPVFPAIYTHNNDIAKKKSFFQEKRNNPSILTGVCPEVGNFVRDQGIRKK